MPDSETGMSKRNGGTTKVRRRRKFWRLRSLRRLTQIFFLALFFYIVICAHGTPTLDGWRVGGPINPHVVFLADPFTWVSAAVASRTIIAQIPFLILIFLVLTLLFGRVFCGWVCPLGTMIDGSAKVVRPGKRELKAVRQRREEQSSRTFPSVLTGRTKYYLLVFLLILAAFGVNLAGLFDPLAILMRGTAFAAWPVGEWGVEQTAGRLAYAPVVSGPMSSFYYWAKDSAFGPVPHSYRQGLLHLGILVGVFALTRLRRRYWCHVFCPLGAFWGLVARVGLWKRRVNPDSCNECGVCGLSCRMEAIGETSFATTDGGECLRCGECADACASSGVVFSFPGAGESDAVAQDERFHLTRRGVLGALGASVVAYPLLRLTSSARGEILGSSIPGYVDAYLLRPPGAREEKEFLQLCVRCGECYKICPQNALHPTLLQAGLEGIWTPAVVPRIGYCEPTCTLCTQVCPTTAIRPLTLLEKPVTGRLGVALFDRARCLPWAKGIPCSVCEEMCPVSPKAIEQRTVEVIHVSGDKVEILAPVMHEDRCTGCGACENKCPVEGASAIRVARATQAPAADPYGYGV